MGRGIFSAIVLIILVAAYTVAMSEIQLAGSSPGTVYVDDDNVSGPWDGSQSHPYQNITSGLENSIENDTIFAYNGTYSENITINKSISLIGESKNNTVIHGGTADWTVRVEASNVTISGFKIERGKRGMLVTGNYNVVSGNDFVSNGATGIELGATGTYQCVCANNTFFNHTAFGILVYGSQKTIANNTIIGSNVAGINLWGGHPNTTKNVLVNNTVRDSQLGIFLYDPRGGNTLRNNTLISNTYHFRVVSHVTTNPGGFFQDIDTSNTADGKPIYYLVNVSDAVYDSSSNGAMFYLIDCSNVTVRDVTVANTYEGIYLHGSGASNHTTDCKIQNVTATNNYYGITIAYHAINNTLECNTLTQNQVGLHAATSINDIYHNSFIGNVEQIVPTDVGYENTWDDGYPSGGNYWSNYVDVDQYGGPYQNETGSDGVWDHPYTINELNQDNYPLVTPYSCTGHDLGITNVTTSKTEVLQGFNVTIEVKAQNFGVFSENSSVTIYANATPIFTKNISLTSRASITLPFSWNTTGFLGYYTLNATIDAVPDEIDFADNTYTDGTVLVRLPIYDVAISNVTTSKTGCKPMPTVGKGQPVEISIIVENQGDFLETFNITSYANSSQIWTQQIVLNPGKNQTLSFAWDTTGLGYGNYTVSAVADVISGETETVDNNFTKCWIIVTISGDINGDRAVDIFDAINLAGAYGSAPGNPTWNPNADLNGDRIIDIFDAIILAGSYGESW